jgi:hypothetical protein
MTILNVPANYLPRANLLAGKTILVTGAGAGIGRSAALCYAGYGATVLLLGRTGSKLESVYDEIEAAGGSKPAIIEMDLSTASEDSYANLAASLRGEFSHLDGILHNAALLGERRPIANAGYARSHAGQCQRPVPADPLPVALIESGPCCFSHTDFFLRGSHRQGFLGSLCRIKVRH